MSRLDYLKWLGIDGVWLNPITSSADADWGYDVTDYCDVHPQLGTLADLERLVSEARARRIRIVLDLVPNHTSDRHPWFLDARSSPDAAHRDWYVWADSTHDGSPPNNWVSTFGGTAWTLDPTSSQFYLHNYLPQQPDLNWWNEEVREAFDEILEFWFSRGVAGFRIDVAHAIIHDNLLRDNPTAGTVGDTELARFGQRRVYNMNRPEVHDILRRWRAIADRYDPQRVLLGETYVFDFARLAAFYGTGLDELHMAFNFPFMDSPFDAQYLQAVVEQTEAALPPDAWPAWTGSNHDFGRFPSRWCDGDSRKVKCALLVLLTLRGTPVLYYGDEIGMTDVEVERDSTADPVGRDGGRTPMQWTNEPGAGFTAPDRAPWLPLGDHTSVNVAAQQAERGSVLSFCRDLIRLRRQYSDLAAGPFETLVMTDECWAWLRGSALAVAVNMSENEVVLHGLEGSVMIRTDRSAERHAIGSSVTLAAWQGAVIEVSAAPKSCMVTKA